MFAVQYQNHFAFSFLYTKYQRGMLQYHTRNASLYFIQQQQDPKLWLPPVRLQSEDPGMCCPHQSISLQTDLLKTVPGSTENLLVQQLEGLHLRPERFQHSLPPSHWCLDEKKGQWVQKVGGCFSSCCVSRRKRRTTMAIRYRMLLVLLCSNLCEVD